MKVSLSSLTKEELDVLTDSLSDKEIGHIYGVTRTAVTHHRKKFNILSWSQKHGSRKYEEHYTPKPEAKRVFSHRLGCNETCFEQIKTFEQAYWLGLLAADGWIVTEKKKPTGVALALHEKDLKLLKEYAVFIGYKANPIRTRVGSNLFQVKMTSKKMANDLIKAGVGPKKSKTIELPELENELMPHFLRGLFDGDGSVSVRNNTIALQITTASHKFAEQIKALADYHTNRACSIGKDREAFVIRWYADNALSFAKYMYQGNVLITPKMERKAEIIFRFEGSGVGHSWIRY